MSQSIAAREADACRYDADIAAEQREHAHTVRAIIDTHLAKLADALDAELVIATAPKSEASRKAWLIACAEETIIDCLDKQTRQALAEIG